MIVGFKTGPWNWEGGKRIVEEDGASMCEIWFDVGRAKQYDSMFAWLADHGVRSGLHHWGIVGGKFKTNLATSDRRIRNETIRQIKQTIDIAQQHQCVYVNIHPGAQKPEYIQFDPFQQQLHEGSAATPEEAEKLMVEALGELNAFARARNVLLTVETICKAEPANAQRTTYYLPGNIPLSAIEKAAASGYPVANDIVHTATWWMPEEPDLNSVWKHTYKFSARVAPQTRLIHINTLNAPWNGTDAHGGITDADWAAGAFPAERHLKQLFSLFPNREDVFVIPEPLNDMQENYRALVRLVESVG